MNQGYNWDSPEEIVTAGYFSDFSRYFHDQTEEEIPL